jgi:hypothetical protein
VAGAVLGALVALGARATSVQAHDVTFKDPPRVSCTGVLAGTVASWGGLPSSPAEPQLREKSRTNPWTTVWYAPDGRAFIRLPQAYELSQGDRFAFWFSFQLPRPLPHALEVEVRLEAPWADSAAPGATLRSGQLRVPRPCSPMPTHRSTSAPLLAMALVAGGFVGLVIGGLRVLRRTRAAPAGQANLKAANLSGARFENADLRGADLERAVLLDAHLEGAILRDARMEKAMLRGAQLQGADLAGVRGLSREQLEEATVDGTTRLPSDLVEGSS